MCAQPVIIPSTSEPSRGGPDHSWIPSVGRGFVSQRGVVLTVFPSICGIASGGKACLVDGQNVWQYY